MKIKSLEEFIKRIKNRGECRSGYTRFYRGQFADKPLLPRVFREEYSVNNESLIFNEITNKNRDEFCMCRCTFDYLLKMQHDGVPTRLLDVTSNPLVAFYFACSEAPSDVDEHKPTVYCIDVPNHLLKDDKSNSVALISNIAQLESDIQRALFKDVDYLDKFKELIIHEFIDMRFDEILNTIDQYRNEVDVESLEIYNNIKKSIANRNAFRESHSLKKIINNDVEIKKMVTPILMLLSESDTNILEIKTTLWNIISKELDRNIYQIESPDLLNEIRLEKPNFEDRMHVDTFKNVFVVKPKQGNPRFIKQSVSFLLFPDRQVYWQAEINITKIEIDKSTLTTILHDLKMMDISRDGLFV